MAGISEFYSRNLATEALKGMTQKAQVGGTPGRAPIGYINTRRRIDGREVRTVTVDPDRAPLIQWAFDAYATGEWTLATLTEALAAKGLTGLPQRRQLPGPVAKSRVAHMLSNRYYLGYVTFRGVEYQGKHQPLISQQTYDQVQEIMRSRRVSGEKRRKHNHYLKGSVFCGICGSRLCLTNAKGRYLYFFCIGRHQRRSDCKQPFVLADTIEEAIERFWQTMRLPHKLTEEVREGLELEAERLRSQSQPEIDWAARRVVELEYERRRLARAVVTGSIPQDLAREEQERVAGQLRDSRRILETATRISVNIRDMTRSCGIRNPKESAAYLPI